MKVFWYKCGLFSWIRYKRPKMVPAMVGCLPLAEKGRSIRSANLPGQPAHHPAPALSQPIHLRALPAPKCPGSSPAPITLDAAPIPRPLLALAPTVTTCYFVESSAKDGSNCCTTVSSRWQCRFLCHFLHLGVAQDVNLHTFSLKQKKPISAE